MGEGRGRSVCGLYGARGVGVFTHCLKLVKVTK